MNFDERLQKAIQRGQRRGEQQAAEAKRQALTEEELKRLHGKYRLELSDHIEGALQKLPNYFPGFRYETIFGERGWGAAVRRDDIRIVSGKRADEYSRLEVTVRPLSSVLVVGAGPLAEQVIDRVNEHPDWDVYDDFTGVEPPRALRDPAHG